MLIPRILTATLPLLGILHSSFVSAAGAPPPVILSLGDRAKGTRISPLFSGISMETETISLDVKDDNAGATKGFTIGGASIASDASWAGKWTPMATEGNTITVTVPATSAVILNLNCRRMNFGN